MPNRWVADMSGSCISLTNIARTRGWKSCPSGEVVGNHGFWGGIRHRSSARRDSLTHERISENPALVNTMEKIAPAEFLHARVRICVALGEPNYFSRIIAARWQLTL